MHATTLPLHLRPRREKLFGHGRAVPLDRNAKTRIMVRARALMRRTEPGKHYGLVTAKAMAVLQALLWGFHNAGTGKCFPSYEAIATAAGCTRSTVARAIKALELAGTLTWANRILRVKEAADDLFGRGGWRWRVLRTSNAYVLIDPKASESVLRTRTTNQVFNLSSSGPSAPQESGFARKSGGFWTRPEQSGDEAGGTR